MRNIFIGAGVSLVALVLVVAALVGVSDRGSSPGTVTQDRGTDAATEDEPAPALPRIGEEAQDGDFTFTVNSVETGVPSLGDEFWTETADGEYVVVDLTVFNHGSSPGFYDEAEQMLVDADENTYSPDDDVTIMMEDGWYEEINPGNEITVMLPYDVPAGTEVAKLQLHYDWLSGGVEVDISQ